ncbi:endopeptidase La [Prauserella marina]|uniref:Lon protease n=1 Tax=Prauserella marina TaxID=530584 RepID=A0A222VJE4_9PSEU|nr:endopeptidase La [Prauserella marina]ASR34048.1 endopeptidase La [Prauserella marina]PWV82683.1 ATP-dependent Lon protease [Prauserella marina]SDC74645.1 ATP-dependent Lon protease [Prauserella marina]
MSQPQVLPVLPVDDDVVLPGMIVPLDLGDTESRAVIEAAQARVPNGISLPGIRSAQPSAAANTSKAEVLLVPRVEDDLAELGTVATVERIGRMPGGGSAAVLRGSRRVFLGERADSPAKDADQVQWVHAEPAIEPPSGERERELAAEFKAVVVSLLQQRGGWQMLDAVQQLDDPSAIADLAGNAPYLSVEQKLELLRTLDVGARLEQALETGRAYLAELRVTDTIRKDVEQDMEKQQKEFLLRRQLDAIRKELGELDGSEDKDDYRARVEAADLPEHVRKAALAEVDKLERTSEQSPEGGWIRTWLDTVLDIPWTKRTTDVHDIAGARAVLDADHAGLDDVKERIIEYLAVRQRRAASTVDTVGEAEVDRAGRRAGAVLALAGPPGVGKTSLGESVAKAMGREFVRVALGGIRDEAEIRGHRRTYVGALPGRIVRAIKEAGSMNPVVLLDEVDKVGADYRGDPTAALLEVLDPEQNHTFRDHYLEVELDLSDVVFLATANALETIPGPLLDRMELVTLDGYTEHEKVTIGRDHLLPRELERAGFAEGDVTVTDAALSRIAAEYTREAGVRDLNRTLAKVLRKVATEVALDKVALPLVVGDAELESYLGRPRHVPESSLPVNVQRTSIPGVATGLAVTGAGGDVLYVEASLADNESGGSGLTLTGQLGDVMKESARIALSYLRSRGAELELPVGDLRNRGVHVHVPAGAVPKDGPSAGVTMTTALASLLTGRLVKADVAMTGEVSLTGRVLPIGGVKQKLLAAHRAGMRTVVIPQRNEPDLDDVPSEILSQLDVRPVSNVRQVLELALEPASAPIASAA